MYVWGGESERVAEEEEKEQVALLITTATPDMDTVCVCVCVCVLLTVSILSRRDTRRHPSLSVPRRLGCCM